MEEKLQKLAMLNNCQAELFMETSRSLEIAIKGSRIHSKNGELQSGAGLRIIKNNRIGFAFFEQENQLKTAFESALRNSKQSPKANYRFAETKRNIQSKRYFDKGIENLDEKETVELAKEMVVNSKFKSIEQQVSASTIEAKLAVIGENGELKIAKNSKTTNFSAFSSYGKNDFETSSYNSSWKKFSPKEVAENAAKSCAFAEKTAKIERSSQNREIIFTTKAASDLIELFIPFNLSGNSLLKKTCRLKPGEQVGNERLSILENPDMPNAPNNTQCDDEGFEAPAKYLIKNGIVENFMFDMQTKAKFGSEQNAKTEPIYRITNSNGFRQGFQTDPGINTTNIEINNTCSENFLEAADAIVVDSFLSSGVNAINGDFSLPIYSGHLIKDGKIEGRIKNAMMVGNFFEILKTMEFEKKKTRIGGFKSPNAKITARII